MGALSVFSLYVLALVLNRYLGAAAGRNQYRAPRSARDSQLEPLLDGADRDAISQHMFKLYEKYNRELNRPREGNTVRSFQAVQESSDRRALYRLNLTSLQDSEVVQSASFHFLFERRPRQRTWFCKRFKTPSCRSLPLHPLPSVRLLFRSVPTGPGVVTGSQGLPLGNVTLHPHRRGVWQMKDVTPVVKEARGRGQLLLSLELDYGLQYQRQPEEAPLDANLPYLLVYADDQALAEPNSVAATLQRYDPFPEGGEAPLLPSYPSLPPPDSRPELKSRVRRQGARASSPIQDNELPEVDYAPEGYGKEELWRSTYLALKPQAKEEKKRRGQEAGGAETGRGAEHERRRGSRLLGEEGEEEGKPPAAPLDGRTAKKGGDGRREERRGDAGKRRGGGGGMAAGGQSPVLSFDERTMRKARRRQRGEAQPRGCARRSLRVDFADIGWSEWVLAPEAFDAYYCAGACGFPLPKAMRPSNHATIQSIVRAVGIVPGVPEPCCVPEKMGSLAVLYREVQAEGLVLKLYPGMSVESCSCR